CFELKRILLENAPGGIDMADHVSIMKIEQVIDAGNAREKRLGSAREAREEMRLNETDGDLFIGFHILAAEFDFASAWCFADRFQCAVVECIMINDAALAHDTLAKHFE